MIEKTADLLIALSCMDCRNCDVSNGSVTSSPNVKRYGNSPGQCFGSGSVYWIRILDPDPGT